VHDDLETIANLKFGKAVESIAREFRAELAKWSSQDGARNLPGLPVSGPAIANNLRIKLRASERKCRALYEIWLDLITRRQNGRITREDIGFLIAKVQSCADAAQRSAVTGYPIVSVNYLNQQLAQQAQTKMQSVVSEIQRELEIKIREQDAFPMQEAAVRKEQPQIQLHINNSAIANLNLGTQLGTITAALQQISNASHPELVEALKTLTEAVSESANLANTSKREAIEAIAELAKQAEAKSEERSTGTVKALLMWLPSTLKAATDLSGVVEKVWPIIKSHFHL